MKRSNYEQFAIVSNDSAHHFNEELNAELYRLRDKNPNVHFSESTSPFFAQIKYIETEEKPETLTEEYESVGALFLCSQCPYFEADTNADGVEDRRSKKGFCNNPHSDFERVLKSMAACDEIYELIKKGGVKLCFTK